MLLLLSVLLAGLLGVLGQVVPGNVLVVSSDGPYQTIQAAIAAAASGDTVEVREGVYRGPVVIDRSIVLHGVGAPVIDGGGRGTVVTILAPDTTIQGFIVRGSGADHNALDAGIQVRGARAYVVENRLDDVLYGISLDDSPESAVVANAVSGKSTLPDAERGDGIRLWYSHDVLVERNHVEGVRDVVIWYSRNVRLLSNTIVHGRYGLHFMFDDGAHLLGNVLRANSVGAYLMYSVNVIVRDNVFAGSRGPSGFGLALKDVDDATLESNWIVDNRVGIWLDTSPRSIDAHTWASGNVVAFNDIGLTMQPAIERNTFSGNSFHENLQQISVPGGGVPRHNAWSENGRGNYWSDYAGIDTNGDGVGDLPYRAQSLSGELMDRYPSLRLLQHGIAAEAIEFAARAAPRLRPTPKLVDDAPLIESPVAIGGGAPPVGQTRTLGLSLGVLAAVAGILGTLRLRPLPGRPDVTSAPVGAVLDVRALSKRFGRFQALEGVDLDVQPGESVALWGPNGAGKTTALRCVLGLLPCDGEIRIAEVDAVRRGAVARRRVGFVPQEVAFPPDLTVVEAITFFAELRGAPRDELPTMLDRLGLTEHARKRTGQLSGGLRQRLALAIALLGDPALLLLDEPTSNLDPAARDLVVHVLAEARAQGRAIVFTSHRIEEVESLADRVLVLDQGRVVLESSPKELAGRLGLRVAVHLAVSRERLSTALAVLTAASVVARPNGHGIFVEVAPSDKARPIRLLEQAGIEVSDFSVVNEPTAIAQRRS